MSLVTRTGDSGGTGLMYNRRVRKSDARVEACGCVDELNAALGVARAAVRAAGLRRQLRIVQGDLVVLMGVLATLPEDRAQYQADGYPEFSPDRTARIEAWVAAVEPQLGRMRGWALPGEDPRAAALDLARVVCRRAERRVSALLDAGQLPNSEPLVYLNRLADALWLAARQVEHERRARLARKRSRPVQATERGASGKAKSRGTRRS
jgi:cob(I)alamin adenosyltransferase